MASVEPSSAPSRAGYMIRASLACVPCRDRHRKCNGDRPICSQCQVDDGKCFYKKSRRGRFDQTILVQDSEQKKLKKGAIQKTQQDLKDTNVDHVLEFSAGSSSGNPAASNTILKLPIKSSSVHHLQSTREKDPIALSVAHGNLNYLPFQIFDNFDWPDNPNILENGDIGMSNYNLETNLQSAAMDQFDESSIFELPETWQATSFSGSQEFSSSNTTYCIGSSSQERGRDLMQVSNSTPQYSSMYTMNLNQIKPPYLGGSFPFVLNPVTSPPFHVDVAPSNIGASEMPLIVYGYGSWTATASSGSIDSLSLGYGFQEAHSGQKQKHIATYRDEAFPYAGYFYRPPASQENAHWLLTLLKRSEPLYHACVSLGLCHQLLGKENTRECQIDFSNELRRHHASSLKGLQARIDSLSTPLDADFVTIALDLLACIWQLLSIEVWRTTEGHWEMHWTALGTILSIVQPGYTNEHLLPKIASGVEPYTSAQKLSRVDNALRKSPISPDAVVLKYYVQCYAWADILCCATFGLKRPFANPFQYLQLLEDGKLDLCSLMGCYNEVMIVILKIALLKDWKETMQSSAQLSLHELIDRSNQLEKDLTHELLNLLEERNHLRHQPELDRSYVTELYIQSALIYLHTVISGPSIYIPEIREHVEKALKALLILPCRLVLRISWPFCIAACMAIDEQQEDFRKITSNAIQTGYLIGTVIKGIKIVEECWRIRKSSPLSLPGIEWTAAMKSLGVRVLLI